MLGLFFSEALQCGLGCCLLHSKETYVSSDVCKQAKITKLAQIASVTRKGILKGPDFQRLSV